MQIEPLPMDGAYLIKPMIFPDDRGLFLEVFSQPGFQEAVGHPLTVAQVNCSSSRRGTVRGLHAMSLPPGQARYTTCVRGAIVDNVVDIRVGSPTFGETIELVLDEDERHALYLAEGLAHGFAPITDEATVVYLCSSTYVPGGTIQVNPLDAELGLNWPTGTDVVLSDGDRAAPTLREAAEKGLLPTYQECRARYEDLRVPEGAGSRPVLAREPAREQDRTGGVHR
ncbi:dTDP-4-dehydrorhamnose 3,5-epimerase family protein [Spirillospora sp. NPDC047279]|uniref:dTDP-4-dehydrorhamnose 3,5-epimerase family protein n=1 Tax=Spirillospora sp. NPDC047279 TaxID=3155478 RepID=UPI0033DBBD42